MKVDKSMCAGIWSYPACSFAHSRLYRDTVDLLALICAAEVLQCCSAVLGVFVVQVMLLLS